LLIRLVGQIHFTNSSGRMQNSAHRQATRIIECNDTWMTRYGTCKLYPKKFAQTAQIIIFAYARRLFYLFMHVERCWTNGMSAARSACGQFAHAHRLFYLFMHVERSNGISPARSACGQVAVPSFSRMEEQTGRLWSAKWIERTTADLRPVRHYWTANVMI
jgi:hypothetical protein